MAPNRSRRAENGQRAAAPLATSHYRSSIETLKLDRSNDNRHRTSSIQAPFKFKVENGLCREINSRHMPISKKLALHLSRALQGQVRSLARSIGRPTMVRTPADAPTRRPRASPEERKIPN